MKDFCVERTMQLKVCEGCGALWLRGRNQSVYCQACAQWLAEFPAPRRRDRQQTYGKRRGSTVVTMPVLRAAAAVAGGAR